MVETDVLVSVPKGFKNGIKLSLENAGHEDIDGRRGDVTVTVQYMIPSDWIITEDRHEVFHNKVITLDSFKHNRTFNVYSPLGDTVAVKIPKLDFQLGHLLEGFNVTVRGFGLLTGEEVKVEAVEEDLIDLDLNMESELDITGNQKKNKREETASTADKRGNLIVHFDIDWSSVGQNTFQDLLLVTKFILHCALLHCALFQFDLRYEINIVITFHIDWLY